MLSHKPLNKEQFSPSWQSKPQTTSSTCQTHISPCLHNSFEVQQIRALAISKVSPLIWVCFNFILHNGYFINITATAQKSLSKGSAAEVINQKQICILPRGVSTCRKIKMTTTHPFGSWPSQKKLFISFCQFCPYLTYPSLTPNQLPQSHFHQVMGKAKRKHGIYVLDFLFQNLVVLKGGESGNIIWPN